MRLLTNCFCQRDVFWLAKELKGTEMTPLVNVTCTSKDFGTIKTKKNITKSSQKIVESVVEHEMESETRG